MKNINFENMIEKFQLAKEILGNFKSEERRLRLDRERQVRLADLTARTHSAGKITLPLPSLYALQWLSEYFGDLDKVKMEQIRDLAAVVWILENQHEPAAVSSLSREQTKAVIEARMSDIPASRLVDYQACVDDMFSHIKKNSVQRQIEILEAAQKLLEADLRSSPPGDLSPLLSRSASGSPMNTTSAE